MASDEKIRESFHKIKGEINFLAGEILALKVSLDQIKEMISKLENTNNSNHSQSSTSPAHLQHISHFPAHNPYYNKDLSDNSQFSIGNRGVPADRQQTDNRRNSGGFLQEEPLKTIQAYSPSSAENFAKKEEDKTKKTEEIYRYAHKIRLKSLGSRHRLHCETMAGISSRGTGAGMRLTGMASGHSSPSGSSPSAWRRPLKRPPGPQ